MVSYIITDVSMFLPDALLSNTRLNFQLDEKACFYIVALKMNGNWKPYSIYHDHTHIHNELGKPCPYCGEVLADGGVCNGLKEAMYEGLRKTER